MLRRENMNNYKTIISFVLGCAVGGTIATYLSKRTYERIAQEEINSVKEAFSNVETYSTDKEVITTEECDFTEVKLASKEDIMKYNEELDNRSYTEYTSYYKKPDEKNEIEEQEHDIEYIEPDEFCDDPDYEVISLTYYADGILTDECDEIIDDVDGTVGCQFISHFGEYEDDAVHVKNNTYKAYYEILRDTRRYSDVVGINTHVPD